MENKKIFVKDINENRQIEGVFLVRDKNNGITKNGKPYIALTVSDKTGEIKGRIWENADKLGQLFAQGDIVFLKAYSVLYQGSLQLNIHAIQKYALENDAMLAEFLPASNIDPELALSELMLFIDKIESLHLKKLLVLIFGDEMIAQAFKSAPAAKSIHHDYLSGLLEHTLNVTRLAADISRHYRNINRDVLVAGAILHDIGKIFELSYEKNFDYTDQGRLIGHITLGDEIIRDKIKLIPDFPSELTMVMRHIILSHHGQYEFGSPKRPKTMEALLLSYLDDIDAKMYGFSNFIKKEKNEGTKWTSYHKLFNRYLYTDTFIEDDASNNSSAEKIADLSA